MWRTDDVNRLAVIELNLNGDDLPHAIAAIRKRRTDIRDSQCGINHNVLVGAQRSDFPGSREGQDGRVPSQIGQGTAIELQGIRIEIVEINRPIARLDHVIEQQFVTALESREGRHTAVR